MGADEARLRDEGEEFRASGRAGVWRESQTKEPQLLSLNCLCLQSVSEVGPTDYHIHLMVVVEMEASKGEVSFSRLPWIRCGRAGREAEEELCWAGSLCVPGKGRRGLA